MPRQAGRPNVLLFVTDQQRADLMGCMGHAQIKTPNLDALAARGVLLRNLYVQGTVCMPSRASIMTGRYPSMHGVTDNGYNLPQCERTVAHLLRESGYFTSCVGRTHIRCSLPHPILPDREFHGFQECLHAQCYGPGLDPYGEYLNWIRKKYPDRYEEAATPRPVDRDDAICASWTTLEDDKAMNAWVTNTSLDVVRRHVTSGDERPFFLWAGTWDPHMRFLVPAPWDRMYPPDEIPLPVRREGELETLPPSYARSAFLKWPQRPGQRADLSLDEAIRNTLSIYWGTISHVDDPVRPPDRGPRRPRRPAQHDRRFHVRPRRHVRGSLGLVQGPLVRGRRPACAGDYLRPRDAARRPRDRRARRVGRPAAHAA